MIIQMPSLNDRVLRLLERIEYRKVVSKPDRNAVFRLRYEAYLREGAISENFECLFFDEADDAPNATLVGVYLDGALAGSIRLHDTCASEKFLPSTSVFPEVLEPQISAGRKIVDPTRFVADYQISRKVPELPYITLRIPWMSMEYFGADTMLAAVRAEHQGFYRRLWGNEVLCAARPYPKLSKPICLTALQFRGAREIVLNTMPFFASTTQERELLFGPESDQTVSSVRGHGSVLSAELTSDNTCAGKVRA